jgi:hypothetical protein
MARYQERIKCYGGPMHGQFFTPEGNRDRFEVAVQPRRMTTFEWNATGPVVDYHFDRVTYTVERFREQRGNAYREMRIAVIDGAKNITTRDKWEIEHDMCAYHWMPIRERNFRKDFEGWFAWCAYRNDNYNTQHLAQEFRRAP